MRCPSSWAALAPCMYAKVTLLGRPTGLRPPPVGESASMTTKGNEVGGVTNVIAPLVAAVHASIAATYSVSLEEEERARAPTHSDLAYPLTGMGRAALALG